MEKDIVTLNEEKGEVTFVQEGYDVEYVMAILKNPYRYEIYQRNIDKMRVAFGLRSVSCQGHDVSYGEAREGD